MRIGYGLQQRPTNPQAQHDALAADGCEQIFNDHASEASPTDRAGTSARRGRLRRDQVVVVELDRLGRSLRWAREVVTYEPCLLSARQEASTATSAANGSGLHAEAPSASTGLQLTIDC